MSNVVICSGPDRLLVSVKKVRYFYSKMQIRFTISLAWALLFRLASMGGTKGGCSSFGSESLMNPKLNVRHKNSTRNFIFECWLLTKRVFNSTLIVSTVRSLYWWASGSTLISASHLRVCQFYSNTKCPWHNQFLPSNFQEKWRFFIPPFVISGNFIFSTHYTWKKGNIPFMTQTVTN